MKLTKPIIFFDLESTGKVVSESRIVQIACVKYFPDGRPCEKKKSFINPGMEIPKEAIDIHGITNEMIAESKAPLFLNIAKSLFEWMDGADLGGYNSDKFDIPMLTEEFRRCKLDFPNGEINFVDVLKYERFLNGHTLGETYKRRIGKELEGAHDAMIDVDATVEILMDQTKSNPDITPAEIDAICQGDKKRFDLAGNFYQNENGVFMSFGKHVDTNVLEIPRHYFENWFYVQDFPKQSKDKIKEHLKSSGKPKP